MKQPGMLNAIREFLQEKPEYIPEFRTVDEGPDGTQMTTDGMIAFTDWSISKGYGDVETSRKFRETLRKRFGK